MPQIERITTVCSHHRVFKSILSPCKGDEHEVRRGYKTFHPQITRIAQIFSFMK